MGADALVEVLGSASLLANATEQFGDTVYAEKLTKEDFHLTPSMASEMVLRTVRLGRAFTFVEPASSLLVETARRSPEAPGRPVTSSSVVHTCVLGARGGPVEVLRVRPEGKGSMDALAWWSGARLARALGLVGLSVGCTT